MSTKNGHQLCVSEVFSEFAISGNWSRQYQDALVLGAELDEELLLLMLREIVEAFNAAITS
jgi:hypothetical protein